MRILIAGATGVIGRPLVPLLLAAGHEVFGMSRTEDRARALDAIGARGLVADALDRDAVARAVQEAQPEMVMQQLTALPQRISRKAMAEGYAQTNRLRDEGTALLLEAAPGARMLAQSIAFVHRPGPGLRSEDDPMYTDASGPMGAVLRTLQEMEQRVVSAGGTVLRYGYLYGPGTWYARDGAYATMARRRMLPLARKADAVSSFLHVDDAAGATVAALDAAPGVYQVVDDDPALPRDWVPAFATAVGAKPPRRLPDFLIRRVAGPVAAYHLLDVPGASNARFKAATGWQPRLPSWREGFKTL